MKLQAPPSRPLLTCLLPGILVAALGALAACSIQEPVASAGSAQEVDEASSEDDDDTKAKNDAMPRGKTGEQPAASGPRRAPSTNSATLPARTADAGADAGCIPRTDGDDDDDDDDDDDVANRCPRTRSDEDDEDFDFDFF